MNKIKIKKVLTVAHTEYMKWIFNPRLIILGVLIIFIFNFSILPMEKHAKIMGSPLNILEPFIAVGNSNLLMIMLPIVYLVLMSDFPKNDGGTLFFVLRVGKLTWLFGQIIFAFSTVITFLLVVFAGSVLPIIPFAFQNNGWSLVVTKYAVIYPQFANDYASSLIEKNLYNQLAPYKAARYVFILITLYFMAIAMILLLFHSLKLKKLGILAAGGVIAFGSGLCLLKSPAMWAFPMAHTKVALHYTEYFREMPVSFHTSFFYLSGLLVALMLFCFVFVKRLNFDTNPERD